MEHTIEDLEQGEKMITIIVSVSELQSYLDKASISLSEQKNIEGFRPGKAPRELVEKKFGAMAVLEQALDDIVNFSYSEVLKEEKLITIGPPKVDIKKITPGADLEYTAQVILLPVVTLGDVEKVKIPEPVIEIKDKDVEPVLNDLQKMRVKEHLVSRQSKIGDKVEIDFDVKLDGVVIEGGNGKKYPLVLGDGAFIPGFEEKIVGMKNGELKKFKLKFPDNYKADLKGKEADFEVKLLSVFERQFPDINDDLAKQAGDYSTLADLKKQIKSNLEIDSKAKADQEWEVKILEKIVAISIFSDIPEVLISNENHRMMHELEENLSVQNIKLDEYLNRIGKIKENLATEWRDAALKRVKTALVARQLAEQEKIVVSKEEIETEKNKMLVSYKDKPQIKDNINSKEFYDYLFHTLTNRKVVDYLKDKIKDN